MLSDFHTPSLHAWYPTNDGETQEQRERRITKIWIENHLSFRDQLEWLDITGSRPPTQTSVKQLLSRISSLDTSEMVELLYPRNPPMFHTVQKYTLSYTLLSDLCEGPFSPEILQQCVQARTACLSAACLFALCGAQSCLEVLLEHGADPDGLESPDSWSYIELPHNRILPVTPMDCALLTDNEDCQLALELYGGRSLQDLISPTT